jgi:hypothetical protein
MWTWPSAGRSRLATRRIIFTEIGTEEQIRSVDLAALRKNLNEREPTTATVMNGGRRLDAEASNWHH